LVYHKRNITNFCFTLSDYTSPLRRRIVMSSYPNAVSPTANGNQWSTVVIEDLLVREFLNGENVAHLVPPTPTPMNSNNNGGVADGDVIPAANPAKQLREANKAFVRYLRGGGISWTASGTPSAAGMSQGSAYPSPSLQMGSKSAGIAPHQQSPYHKSPSPTPNNASSSQQQQQQQHRAFPIQQSNHAYNAPTPSSAPTVPTSPANALAMSMKSPSGYPMQSGGGGGAFPLSNSSVNTASSPKGGAGAKPMVAAVSKPGVFNSSSSTMFPNQKSQHQKVPYSTTLGAVHRECNRVQHSIPSNIPSNAALSTGKRRPHDDLIRARIEAQDTIDPDLIFAQPRDDFPLEHIFSGYPKVLEKLAQNRGMSGDWNVDTFTQEEENKYKVDMGYTALGLSQSNSSFLGTGL
jgi:hypothetical protein